MKMIEFGKKASGRVLIQPVDDHDLKGIEAECREIEGLCGNDFRLVAVKVDSWNADLSPWEAPAVFGRAAFGGRAQEMLQGLLSLIQDVDNTFYIGGYSLAGLFALWAAYQTDVFSGVAAASPSVWFPGFMEYASEHDIHADRVYLSLGDREEKTKNAVVARVGDCIRQLKDIYADRGMKCCLEWNRGNHFKDADIRTAKAFSWVLSQH